MKRRKWKDYSEGEKLFVKVLFGGLIAATLLAAVFEPKRPSSASTYSAAASRAHDGQGLGDRLFGNSERSRKIDSVVKAGVEAGYDEDEVRRSATAICNQDPECR